MWQINLMQGEIYADNIDYNSTGKVSVESLCGEKAIENKLNQLQDKGLNVGQFFSIMFLMLFAAMCGFGGGYFYHSYKQINSLEKQKLEKVEGQQ